MKKFQHFAGIELLKNFREEFNKYEKERQELANAEKLFDLPITMYPEMQQMEKEIKGMELIYAIYEKQKVWNLMEVRARMSQVYLSLVRLTHYSLVLLFYTSWKHQKPEGFFMF